MSQLVFNTFNGTDMERTPYDFYMLYLNADVYHTSIKILESIEGCLANGCYEHCNHHAILQPDYSTKGYIELYKCMLSAKLFKDHQICIGDWKVIKNNSVMSLKCRVLTMK